MGSWGPRTANPPEVDWLVKKGKIKLGKLSHNELCRFCFELYIINQEQDKKLKEFINLFDDLEKKAKKNGTKD